jgi:hypothetical protein
VIIILKIPLLPIIPPGGLISENLKEGWIMEDSEPSSSSEITPQPQKPIPPPPEPGLPTPRVTPDTPGPMGSLG